MHIIGAQRVALLVQQVRNALQHDRGLAATRNAVDQQHGHVFVAHHLVLLALDGGRDVAKLR